LNHLVLEHLSGVKGGCPLEEAYYLKLSLFQGVEYFSEVFLCYIDIWFLTDSFMTYRKSMVFNIGHVYTIARVQERQCRQQYIHKGKPR
jgi:hypothetical protein